MAEQGPRDGAPSGASDAHGDVPDEGYEAGAITITEAIENDTAMRSITSN